MSQHLGQAEVGDLGLIRRADQDVGGLEIAVEHALLVGVVNRLGHRLQVSRRLLWGERLLAGQLLQVGTIHIFHREEVPAFVLAHLVDGDDMSVL